MKWAIAILFLAFLTACVPQGPTCSGDYIANGQTCCLDKDGNSVCDFEEKSGDCNVEGICEQYKDICAPEFKDVVEEVIVYKYVCTNGSVVNDKEDCGFVLISNAQLFDVNEDMNTSIINTFNARPACRGEYKAVELHIELENPAREIVIQAQTEPEGEFTDIANILPEGDELVNRFIYIGFCEDIGCSKITDAQLPDDTASLLRAKIVYSEREHITRDRLVDPTPEGDYGKKNC